MSFLLDKKKGPEGPLVWVFSGWDQLSGCKTRVTASAECPPSIDPPKNASPFRDRCRAIAEQFDLSPREAEVFTCLAKGRNAEYIQQKLFISSNTAKTHITHIYRKMGINSQQRLIDLVDREEQPPA